MKLLRFIPTRIILVLGLVLLAMTKVTYNVSDSATPVGIYLIRHDAQIKRGALVLLRNPLKRVVALPGDTVTWAKEGVYVNGALLPNSARPDSSPYPAYPYGTQKLAEGQYLFMGSNPLSFDGRYEGPQPESLIISGAQPVWTEDATNH